MNATDTSFLPLPTGASERPGVDEREHPGGATGRGSDSCIAYLNDVQRVIIESAVRDQMAELREPH
jgi:hypothetical protein